MVPIFRAAFVVKTMLFCKDKHYSQLFISLTALKGLWVSEGREGWSIASSRLRH